MHFQHPDGMVFERNGREIGKSRTGNQLFGVFINQQDDWRRRRCFQVGVTMEKWASTGRPRHAKPGAADVPFDISQSPMANFLHRQYGHSAPSFSRIDDVLQPGLTLLLTAGSTGTAGTTGTARCNPKISGLRRWASGLRLPPLSRWQYRWCAAPTLLDRPSKSKQQYRVPQPTEIPSGSWFRPLRQSRPGPWLLSRLGAVIRVDLLSHRCRGHRFRNDVQRLRIQLPRGSGQYSHDEEMGRLAHLFFFVFFFTPG